MTNGPESAIDIRDQASKWLARRMLGPWNDADQGELDAWLARSLAHEIAFLRMEAGWSRTERLAVLRDPGPPRTNVQTPVKSRPVLFRAAALFAAAAALGVASSYFASQPDGQSYSTPVGGHKIITMADGSRIELNTDTAIQIQFRAGSREVTLVKGEAYFQVQHDAARPFVVLAADHRVTDLGTKFLVHNEAGRLQVSLVEGKAELQSVGADIQQHSVVLTSGDVAVATANSLSVSRKSQMDLHNELGWRRGVIVFSHVTLGDAAIEFNRYNMTKIVITDASVRSRVIGATLPTHDVEAFADVAREIFGLRIKKRENEVLISR